jgi:hypothetical protein
MASHNEFPGYVQLPKKLPHKPPRKLAGKSNKKTLDWVPSDTKVRLDFNFRILGAGLSDSKTSKLVGFSLRLFTPKFFKEHNERTEIGVHLRAEEWLDLIQAMKQEYEWALEMLKDE